MTGHVIELLSEFIDGALPEAERAAVEKHVAACEPCRTELEDLRSVQASLAALPRKPLPPGFMARLQAKREAPSRPAYMLPFPVRVAAFAASSFIVAFVVFEQYRQRPAEILTPAAAVPADLAAPAPSGLREMADKYDGLAGGKVSGGFGGGAGPAAAPAPVPASRLDSLSRARTARSLAAVRGSAQGRAPGRPYAAEPEADEGALSKSALSQGADDSAGAAAAAAPQYTNEELFKDIERQKAKEIRRIITPAEKRAEMAAELATPQGFANAMQAAGFGSRDQSVRIGGDTPDLKTAAAGAKLEVKGAVRPFLGAVAHDREELAEAWKDASLPGAPPAVDFQKHTVVIPPGVMVDVRESVGVIIVRYRSGPRQYALIERTDLPVSFEPKQ